MPSEESTSSREQAIEAAELRERVLGEVRERIDKDVERLMREAASRIDSQTENAHRQVGEAAIEKTLKIIGETRQWLVVVVVTLALGTGVIGWQAWSHLYDRAMRNVEERMQAWLSVNTDSPVKTTLEQLRTRAILDAQLIRAARQQQSDGFGTDMAQLDKEEIHRLCLALKDPRTTDADFADAAKLVALNTGPLSFQLADPRTEEVVRTVFDDRKYSYEKRKQLLISWSRSLALTPYADALLDRADTSADWRQLAFQALSFTARARALERARKELSRTGDPRLAESMAISLAQTSLADPALAQWLDSPKTRQRDDYPVLLARIALEPMTSTAPPRRRHSEHDLIVRYVRQALDAGVQIHVDRQGLGGKNVVLRSAKGSGWRFRDLPHVAGFLGNEELLTALLADAARDIHRLRSLVQRLSVDDEQRAIARIQADLGAGGALRLADGRTLSRAETDEPVLLQTTSDASKQDGVLMVTWRSKTGAYQRATVAKLDGIAAIRYRYAYDTDVAGRLDVRRVTEHFLL
jgi:hypothetical protein